MRRIRMLALCTLAVVAASAVATATASAFTIIIDSEGTLDSITIRDHIVIKGCLGTSCTSMSARAGNTLTGVTFEGEKCNSAGAKEGEVKTEPVTDEIGFINKATGEVGLEERPTSGTLLARFTCGAKDVELRGGVIGVLTPTNKKVTAKEELTDTVAVAGGKQAVTKFEGGPTVVLEKQVDGGGFSEAPATDSGTGVPSGTVEVKTTSTPELSFAPEAEYGQCLAQKKGRYADGNCTTRDEKKGKPKGKFEWHAGPPASCIAVKKGFYSDSSCATRDEKKGKPKGKFEKAPGPGFTSAGGSFELSTAAATVACKASTGSGTITSPIESTGALSFTGCETLGKKCTSAGQSTGTIARALATKEIIIWWSFMESAWGIEVVLGTAYVYQFDCEGVEVRVRGSGTTLQSPHNVMSTTSTKEYVAAGAEEGAEAEFNVGSGFGPPEPVVEKGDIGVHYASPIEIKAP